MTQHQLLEVGGRAWRQLKSPRHPLDVRRLVRFWAPPVIAGAIAVVMILPADSWREPATDVEYIGFDPNLVYASEAGRASSRGLVEVLPDTLRLTSLPGSELTVHLLTSPLSFTAAMNLRVSPMQSPDGPFSIGIWNPGPGALPATGHFLEFGAGPGYLVTAKTVADGVGGVRLKEGHVVKDRALGRYSPGQLLHIRYELDRQNGRITTYTGSDEESPP